MTTATRQRFCPSRSTNTETTPSLCDSTLSPNFFSVSALWAVARVDDTLLYAVHVVVAGGVVAELVGDMFEIMIDRL
jgi:hypothetical protein